MFSLSRSFCRFCDSMMSGDWRVEITVRAQFKNKNGYGSKTARWETLSKTQTVPMIVNQMMNGQEPLNTVIASAQR